MTTFPYSYWGTSGSQCNLTLSLKYGMSPDPLRLVSFTNHQRSLTIDFPTLLASCMPTVRGRILRTSTAAV